ncbi:MAG TPA: HAD family phosphatase [Bacteriovoracaceae bacterium]|nr:HAD family phosphatase [Bacteriovoracaceae bacterium]
MKNNPTILTKIPHFSELQRRYPGLRALFFDMDGTLFDTEKYHETAMLMFGSEYSIKAPAGIGPLYDLMVGKADHLVFDLIRFWQGFPQDWSLRDFVTEKNKNVFEALIGVEASEFFPRETMELLVAAKKEKIFVALVTSSEKVITQKLLEITGLEEFFDLVLTRDDCPFHKPDPWPYLEAAKKSGAHPQEIVIFEDSKVGLEAATAAGANVVKVEWFVPLSSKHELKV